MDKFKLDDSTTLLLNNNNTINNTANSNSSSTSTSSSSLLLLNNRGSKTPTPTNSLNNVTLTNCDNSTDNDEYIEENEMGIDEIMAPNANSTSSTTTASNNSNNNNNISDEFIDKAKMHRSVGVCTDTQDLGVCEPGTSILLEGIIWNETSKGVLILNVTWRGKSFVGSLIDTNKAGWAPPR